MASNVFRFDESWSIPDASPHEVWDVLARGELLPQWWRGVNLKAERLDPGEAGLKAFLAQRRLVARR